MNLGHHSWAGPRVVSYIIKDDYLALIWPDIKICDSRVGQAFYEVSQFVRVGSQ
jgi:hypothetical protein